MPYKLKSEAPGQLTVGNGLTRTSTQVTNDGRTTVQFHRTPGELAAWFKGLHENPQGPRKIYNPRKDSSTSFGEKGVGGAGPRLNIAIHIVGSRGDVQPFIPIAQLLSKPPYGHRVRICTHPVFKNFVESKGHEFFSIGGDPEALMAYMVKNPGLLPSRESFKAGDISKRRKEMGQIMHGAWRSCIEAGDGMGDKVTASDITNTNDLFIADVIIANPPSMAHIHCAEKLGIPFHMVFTMPWSPTHTFHHPLAAMQYGQAEIGMANYLSFTMMELLTWQGLGDVINKFRTRTLKLDPISPLWGHHLLSRLHVPFTYLWSEALIPKPPDWGSHIHITGFSFLDQASSYTPPDDLIEFLGNSDPAPVYVGFGSIVVDDPQALTDMIFKALKLANMRGIVSKGWGGIGSGEVPDHIYLIGDCPHDWLFQHVSCVVHHGGAGTTAAGLAAGRPTVVVPFFGDQPFWGQMIARAGAGPAPIPYKKITVETLAESIAFALRPETRAAAREVAASIAEEDGAGGTARDIQERLDSDGLSCDICPNRLAIWRHKKTDAHLSSFAAYFLVSKGVMKPSHLELLRHKHWYVDEGAETPIIGLLAAASGFFTDIGLATSHYMKILKSDPNSTRRRSSIVLLKGNSHLGQITSIEPNLFDESAITSLEERYTVKQLEKLARKMAQKPVKSSNEIPGRATFGAQIQLFESKRKWVTRERAEQSRALHVARASKRYVVELGHAGLKTPVAVCYNVANGFRNLTSLVCGDDDVRRRDEIRGFKSGCKVAGKEFVLGSYEAVSGFVVRPYRGAKKEGVKGLGKGFLRGTYGLFGGLGGASFGLAGYTLKGIEKELSKHRLTELKAEILLIRFRQGLQDCWQATEEEKREVVERWNALHTNDSHAA